MIRYLVAIIGLCVFACSASADDMESRGWELIFEDHFKGKKLDLKKWRRIPYMEGKAADWRRYQSQDEELAEISGSSIKLWGRHGRYITQNNQQEEQETYACGGITTQGVFSFQYGRVDVRARFSCVQGCWPAIWMMPDSSPSGWPSGGEIDIMEHLNHETKVYQTIHLHGSNGRNMSRTVQPQPTIEIKGSKKSKKQGHPPAAMSGWHVYSLEWTPEAITFYLDGKKTGTMRSDISTNWPFSRENNTFYLLIDQQIGGGWVEGSGSRGIDRETLAKEGAVLEVDYIKVYSSPQYKLPDEEKKPKKKKSKKKSKLRK